MNVIHQKPITIMKQFIFFAFILLLVSCQGSKKVDLEKLDRGNPKTVAIAVLNSYQEKDLATLHALATPRNAQAIKRMMLSEKLVQERRIFTGYQWDKIKDWKGDIIEVRFSDDLRTAYAMFHQTKEGDEIAVVQMVLQQEKWNFDNIISYTQESFDSLGYVMEE